MKKQIIIGMSVFAMGMAITPLNTHAAVRINYGSGQDCRQVLAGSNDCIQDQIKDSINSSGKNGNVIIWGNVQGSQNCPQQPFKPGIPDIPQNPDKPSIPDKPVTPDKPEMPDTPQNPDKPGNGDESTLSYARQVVKLVNEERAKEGLTALTIDEKVEKAAIVRAKEIQSSFSHTRPNGSSFSTVLTEHQVSYRGSGENIAWGQKTPEEVVKGWMNSPGHRANIMNKNYTSIGVGNQKDGSGTMYWAQLFTY